MLRQEIAELKTGVADLRRFALTVGGVLLVVGGWGWARGKGYSLFFLLPGAALLITGLVWPRGLRPIYLGWMTAALAIGFVVSTVLLTLFFFAVILPVGWAARLSGNDFLQRRLDRARGSYWHARPSPGPGHPEDYEKQF